MGAQAFKSLADLPGLLLVVLRGPQAGTRGAGFAESGPSDTETRGDRPIVLPLLVASAPHAIDWRDLLANQNSSRRLAPDTGQPRLPIAR